MLIFKSTEQTPQLMRPAQHTDRQLISSILDGTFPPGTLLPAERKLAQQFGVTRPTIREALQRLASEGWVTIRHGKATEVNDYWQTGGLGLLGTLVKHTDHLPDSLIFHLLDFRAIMLPPAARYAVFRNPAPIQQHLEKRTALADNAEDFTAYDWQLQVLFAKHSGNPVFSLLLNDFASVFFAMGQLYFDTAQGRAASAYFYETLERAIAEPAGSIEVVVADAMAESIAIWKQIHSAP
ncbi:MAG: GntR family transcriptional regulator [Thermodesulfobacteriota bacterium]